MSSISKEKLKKLLQSISIVSSSLNSEVTLQKIMLQASSLLETEGASIFLIDESNKELLLKIATNLNDTQKPKIKVPEGKGFVGFAVKTDSLININDAQSDPKFFAEVDNITGIKTKTCLTVPLKIEDKLIGAVQVINKKSKDRFDEEDEIFLQEFAHLAGIALNNARLHEELIEKEKLETDLRIAYSIQKRLLPSDKLVFQNFKLFGSYHPAKFVSGDYYDYFKLSDSEVFFTIGDVTGKGTQASLLMASVKAFLIACLNNNSNLTDIVNKLNNYFYSITLPDKFITMFFGVLNIHRRRIAYINAGHEKPIIIRDCKTLENQFKSELLLGVIEDHYYETEEIDFYPNDILFLYTDGITEANNTSEELFGLNALNNILVKCFDDPECLLQIIPKTIGEYSKGLEQSDDITFLILQST